MWNVAGYYDREAIFAKGRVSIHDPSVWALDWIEYRSVDWRPYRPTNSGAAWQNMHAMNQYVMRLTQPLRCKW